MAKLDECSCLGMQEFNWAYATLQRKVQATPAESWHACRHSETVVDQEAAATKIQAFGEEALVQKV